MTKNHILRFSVVLASLSLLLNLTLATLAFAKPLVYCAEGGPSSFNPQLASDGISFNAGAYPIYNRLVTFKDGGTEIEPSLAEKWEISKDGLVYTFLLRKGVTFHENFQFKPSRDLQAADVIFSFDRQRDPKHPFHKVGGGSYVYFESMDMGKSIESIQAKDPYTVVFKLKTPQAPFLANLAMPFASIFSEEYAQFLLKKNQAEKIDTQPLGTGPFILDSYQKDSVIRYSANAKYFLGAPKIEKLIFAITPDPSLRFQKIKTGECHFMSYPQIADLVEARKNPKLKILEKEGFNIGYLAINTEKGPLKNIKVRQAISLALQRSKYIKAIYLDQAMLAKNPMPPSQWGYNDKTPEYTYNIQEAKNLLKDAGFPNGFTTEIWTMPVSRPYNPQGKKMGELMQEDLAAIGIKSALISYDWPTYLDKAKKGEHQLLQIGWTGDNGDPDNFLSILLSCAAIEGGSNYARWCNKDYDTIITQAAKLSDPKKRKELYEKAQLIVRKEIPIIPLAHSRVFKLQNSNLEGFAFSPFGTDEFSKVNWVK